MTRTPQQERLFEASSQLETDDPLVIFLYSLMRNDLPVGAVANTVREATENLDGPSTLTNGYLGRYAEFLARELRTKAQGPAQAITEEQQTALDTAFTHMLERVFTSLVKDGTLTQQQADKTLRRFAEVGEDMAVQPVGPGGR